MPSSSAVVMSAPSAYAFPRNSPMAPTHSCSTRRCSPRQTHMRAAYASRTSDGACGAAIERCFSHSPRARATASAAFSSGMLPSVTAACCCRAACCTCHKTRLTVGGPSVKSGGSRCNRRAASTTTHTSRTAGSSQRSASVAPSSTPRTISVLVNEPSRLNSADRRAAIGASNAAFGDDDRCIDQKNPQKEAEEKIHGRIRRKGGA